MKAIASVRDFGPAEAGLCRLYEESKEYEQAIAACNVALEKGQKRDFGNHKKAEKWIKDVRERTLLNWRREWNQKRYERWQQACGLYIQNSENGSTVDPSSDSARYLANCVISKAVIDAYQVDVDRDIAAYNKQIQ